MSTLNFRIAVVHAELVFVARLQFCASAEPVLAGFGDQHAAVFASLCFSMVIIAFTVFHLSGRGPCLISICGFCLG